MATVAVDISDDFTFGDTVGDGIDPQIPVDDMFAFTERVGVQSSDPAHWNIAPPFDADL